MHSRLFALFILACLTLTGLSEAEPAKKILFVGNSYTGQIKATVTQFFAASPHQNIELTYITPGGRTLAQHLENEATVKKITEGGWDIVVLQDQSQTPAVLPKKFLTASESLHRIIEKSGAKTAYYETWGRRDGDKANPKLCPDYRKMQTALTKSYQSAARRDNATLVRVGEAWRVIRVEKPALGEQLYKNDGSHPSAKGAYLAASCFYTALTGSDPRKVVFDGGLDPIEAKYLREKAADIALPPGASFLPLKEK